MEIDDTWFFTTGEADGKPSTLRGRQNLRHLVGLKTHPRLLRIQWQYEPVNDSGMPSSDQSDQMETFENTIIPELEKDNLCIFFSIEIHNGVKEWVAYCSDVAAAGERSNKVLEGHPVYPITLTTENNPDWEQYRSMLDAVGLP